MTITETAPDTGTTTGSAGSPQNEFGELGSVLGTGDHARIGRMFLGGSFIGLVAALVVGLLLDIERSSADSVSLLDNDMLLQMVSAHRMGLVLLFALPALLGLAFLVVPLQVGASTVAFGRAAAMSLWTWALGSALWIAGYLVGGGPGGSDLRGTDLWLLASIMVIASLLVASACVVTTVLGLRTRGMTLGRVPLFSFSMLVAGSIWLLTLPVAIANLVLIYIDHRYAQALFGANEQILPQLGWVVGQPQIYAIAIPVLGIAGDIIPVFAQARQRFYGVSLAAIGVFGALSIGAFAQTGMPGRTISEGDPLGIAGDPLYIGMAVLAILPVLMVLALGADTMRGGRLKFGAPIAGALLSGLVLLGATVAGAVDVVEPLDLFGTTWALGQFQLTVGALIVGVVAGIWFWAPKIYGRTLASGPGQVLSAIVALGSLLSGAALLAAGALDQPDSPAPGAVRDGVEALDLVAAAGAALVLLGVVAVIAAVFQARNRDDDTPDDPWGGHTLEWATASPPVRGNFAEAPEVLDERPLFTPNAEEDAQL
ncbi:MAG: cbb3-type cytochrome c oxidase subunit I [Acidimicrobiia bacterium]|nr:cbb3-type cytochrome c oxidase subunit I [Acidimicrobiia bacterium]